jgi:acyl carrier protein
MSKNIEGQIYKVFSDTFNYPISDIKPETSPADTALWDSLGQLNLVSSLEQHFSIIFDYEELFKIVSVESIIEIIKIKLDEK